MKCIVAGCRDFHDYALLSHRLDFYFSRTQPEHILSGMATGADTLALRYAHDRGIPVLKFPADWKTHGRGAGPMRNKTMAKAGTHLVAFWDGKSRGTKNMIDTAQRYGLIVRVVRF